MNGLLDGIRVVECAVLLTGDYLGMLLADEGADVVKVENPGMGDWIRDHMGEVAPRYSPYHLYVNRNKRSVTADLKTKAGRDIVHRLVAEADVFITGFTGPVPKRLGIDYEALRKVKPDLVYCQATGFGAEGPYASLPTHGEMMQALVASPRREPGPDGHPRIAKDYHRSPPPEGVVVGPLFAAYGIAAALLRRERSGEGCYVDVACSDAVLAGAYPVALFPLNEGRYTKHAMHPGTEGRVAARYTYYRTKDGKHLLFCPEEPKFWSRFCQAVGRPDLDSNQDESVTTDYGDDDLELYDELRDLFSTRNLDEWVQLFLDHKIPGGPALPYEEAREDRHVRFREIVVEEQHPVAGSFTTLGTPLRVPGRTFKVRRPAPAVGEHTDEVLSELGLRPEEIQQLRGSGAV
jgi:crotonobetainyl-CoA:carnitine CoA-transferase CaiB-like acyl-CoA transferase